MRLIDADAFIKMMEEKCDHTASLDEWVLKVCRGGIKLMPTIETQPERTGHWIEFPNHNAYVCSECTRIIKTTDGKNNVYRHYPYCHCGARMLKEGEDHD